MALGDIAARLGLPVFPCADDKRPIVATGFKAATRDAPSILAAFNRPGANLIGVPTGRMSGLIAIDVDIRSDKSGMAWLDDNREALPETRTHKTRSGGLHLIFQAPHDVEITNSASRIAPGVDVRGEGGYIIVPPSPGYGLADPSPPAEMPRWLIRACLKPETPAPPPVKRDTSDRYAGAALDGEVLAVVRSTEGQRNHQLNVSAVKLGSLVASGLLSRAEVEASLTRAALGAGLDPRETAATIASGIGHGLKTPRTPPERPAARPEPPAPSSGTESGTGRDNQPGKLSLPLIWFDEIEPCLDVRDFVQGVLVEQGAAVVYGESNAGKTFWTTDLALHVAAGAPWNGRRVEQGGVIYCVLEGGAGFRNRVSAWRDQRGLAGQRIPFAAIPAALNLLDPNADTPRLISTIKAAAEMIEVPVKLIVIDTLSRAMAGGNENAPDDMGALVRNMDLIREYTGASVLFVHHSGKDQAQGARGHSLLRAAIDTEIEVTADDSSEAKTATIVKQRDLKKGAVFGFTLGVVELGENRHGEQVTTCVVVPADGDVEPINKQRGKGRSNPNATLAARALRLALDKAGARLPELPEYPPRTMAVSATVWREEFYHLKAGSADTNKHAFSGGETALLAADVITARNGLVWFVKDQTGQKGGTK